MKRYGNLSGASGVDAYQVGDDRIGVRFRSGDVYWYTKAGIGAKHLTALKRLALQGQGLATYISTHPDVKDRYESKEPDD
ncbi:hypothetical protein [Paraburkholderia sp. BCC1886]|uniref:hypothetical protein n=1 Tax=Paraburkholderia sp. BCC1886 TaxID=2562670 RepID=UPI001182B3EB|nr:hypothetical protein [Paraburkholderia sp. BCC1886]